MENNFIQGTTGLTGLIGYPLKHSLSPSMHNSAFRKLGLDLVYLAFEIEDGSLQDGLNAMRTLNVKGFNVTMPHKQKIVQLLDGVSDDAKIIESVNTVKNENGKLIGYNTDGKGLVKALEESGIAYKGKKVVILGAGGAARAIAIQLAFDGAAQIVMANRTIIKAKMIINTINEKIPTSKGKAIEMDEEIIKEELKDASILINCTSIGMKSTIDQSPISNVDTFNKDVFVVDIIYDPLKTKFMSMAEEVGCKTMNGIDMLIYQGDLSFNIWTGEDMPIEYIKEVLFKTK